MITGERRTVARVKRSKTEEEIHWDPADTDVDNHADTHVFGKNFRPIYFTSEVCSVAPFLDEYQEQEEVQICTAATAFDTTHGETIILRFGQGLWFGNRMDKSLLNPNQCRFFGIPICDDPTDPYRQIGINAPDDMFIPFEMRGTTCGFTTRCPSDEELSSCRTFTLSNEQTWDPTDVDFVRTISSADRGKKPVSSSDDYRLEQSPTSRNINCVGTKVEYKDNCNIHDFDRALAHTGLVEDLITDRAIKSVNIHATYSDKRHHGTDPALLARKWGIGLQKAKDTLKVTTQLNIRSAILPLSRRYKTDMLSQRLRRLSTRFYTDTGYGPSKSLAGNTCMQIFTDGEGFVVAYPMSSKAGAGDMLQRNCNDVGVPNELHMDNAPEMIRENTAFQEVCRNQKIKTTTIEPKSPWQNKCENIIGVIGKKATTRRARRKAPKCVWDYGYVWECEIYSRTAGRDGRTGLERITGDTVDISEWLEFEFYDIVRYWDNRENETKDSVGRWLGVSHHVGSALCYWILTNKGTVISRTTVQHWTEDEVRNPETQSRFREYHEQLKLALGSEQFIHSNEDLEYFVRDDVEAVPGSGFHLGDDEYFGPDPLNDIDDILGANTDEQIANDTYDQYIGAEIPVSDPKGMTLMAKVVKKTLDNDTNVSSKAYNPLQDHSRYEVVFPDGHTDELTANVIAEAMLSNIDTEGRHYSLLNEISDHKKDGTAISRSNGFYETRGGTKKAKKTTRGWKLLVEWKDGSVDWIPLVEMKNSYPIETAEYAKANNLEEEPAFKWWVNTTLKKRDRIIGKVKSKYWRNTHKFGIRIPKTVQEAYEIDKETGTDFWTKAIAKEMKNVRIAFESVDGVTPEQMREGKVKPGFNYITTHMIFDIKMDGKFTRKARLVADGHKTMAPAAITYSSVVSRDSVRIALMVASLNDLDVFACDIGNAYLNAQCREKLWTIAGKEFGSEAGNVMIISRALYGLKSSGAAWRAKLAETLRGIGYFPSEADPDVWLKKATKVDGTPYYKYMLVYVDDVLHIASDPNTDMKAINEIYRLKDGAGPPDRYLGANVEKVQLQDGSVAWSTTCVDYLKGAIENVDKMLKEADTSLKKFGDGHRPYPSSYRPELEVSKELNEQLLNRYQQLIGVLRWSIELGRIDIMTEVSCLSQHLCSPREGHLLAVYKIFRYLQKNISKIPGRMVYDGKYYPCSEDHFKNSIVDSEKWKDFYPEAAEALPGKCIEPLGNPAFVKAFVDANHAGNMANRRSHTGLLIYINNAPIIWYSKRQNTVETSSFGSEYVALRICVEMIEALRYKLRCFGVPVVGPADILCDNKSVATNSSVPTSVLNKRHNAICYHRVREAQAAGTIRVGWIPGEHNLADLFTKTTMAGNTRHGLVVNIFNDEATRLEPEVE